MFLVTKKGLSIGGQNCKSFNRIKKPFLEDDFFTAGYDSESEGGVTSQTDSQETDMTSSLATPSQTSSCSDLASESHSDTPEVRFFLSTLNSVNVRKLDLSRFQTS